MIEAESLSIWKTLFFVLKYSVYILIFLIILANPIQEGLKNNSFSVFLLSLGKTTLLSTNNMNEESLKILNNNINLEGNLYKKFLSLSNFLSSFLMVIFWIYILAWIYSKTFISNNSNTFVNYFLAFITFIAIQEFTIISYQGINNNLKSWFGNEESILYYFKVPFIAFINAFKASFYLFTYLFDKSIKLTNYINKT